MPATEVGTKLKQPGGLASRGRGRSSCGVERAVAGNCTHSSRCSIDT